MRRPLSHLCPLVLISLLATASHARSVGIVGSNSNAAIVSLLQGAGHTVVDHGRTMPSAMTLANYEVLFMMRYSGNVDTANWVRNGGVLITEWTSTDWALNTEMLLDARGTGNTHPTPQEDVNFLPAAGSLAQGVSNPYSDFDRTHCFITLTSIGPTVDILATSPQVGPCILSGSAGSGSVLIIGYDWADSFGSANMDTQQLILNAVEFNGILRIGTVNVPGPLVAPGQNGIAVTFDCENTGPNAVDVTASDVTFRDAMGMDLSTEYSIVPIPGNPTVIASGATENFAFTVSVGAMATLGTITVDGSIDATDQVTAATSRDRSASTPATWDVVGALALIRTVDAAQSMVVRGEVGLPVTMTVENVGLNALNVTAIDLSFTGTADRTPEYTVTPDPGNPTMIAAGVTGTFQLAVDVDVMATLETIVIDGSFSGDDVVSGASTTDMDSDLTDTWGVVDALARVRVVDSPSSTVSQGSTGHPVTVTVENLGVGPLNVVGLLLRFTGTADRTSEYAVSPDPMNPIQIAVGAVETFAFTVDVDPAATIETVTLDAVFSGFDTMRGVSLVDADADVTDSWDVVACGVAVCGDCSGDQQVTIIDALLAAQHSAGLSILTGPAFTSCNVLGALEPAPSAVVDILDALSLAQFSAGLPVTLTCC